MTDWEESWLILDQLDRFFDSIQEIKAEAGSLLFKVAGRT